MGTPKSDGSAEGAVSEESLSDLLVGELIEGWEIHDLDKFSI